MKDETTLISCAICGRMHPAGDLTDLDGDLICPDCLEAHTIVCRDCGARIFQSRNAGTREHPLCQNCYEDVYTHCENCGELLHMEDAWYFDRHDDTPYCRHCFEELSSRDCIHEYGYKPAPIFYGKASRYFGVELEIDGAGEDSENAESVLAVGNRLDGQYREHIYCKHDGSLNEGFEIVTHPMTLNYHLEQMPWEAVTNTARELNYLSHQAGTCGLHVHVNRDSLGRDEEQQDATIARILFFVEKNWNELLTFSRRTERQMNHWAARYGYKDQPQELLEHVKKGCANRYTCVNLTNVATVEFRMFRGTLKLNTLYATLQLVDRICNVALCLADEEVRRLSWSQFVGTIREPELIQYLKERRLYVNDSVETEEKV